MLSLFKKALPYILNSFARLINIYGYLTKSQKNFDSINPEQFLPRRGFAGDAGTGDDGAAMLILMFDGDSDRPAANGDLGETIIGDILLFNIGLGLPCRD